MDEYHTHTHIHSHVASLGVAIDYKWSKINSIKWPLTFVLVNSENVQFPHHIPNEASTVRNFLKLAVILNYIIYCESNNSK